MLIIKHFSVFVTIFERQLYSDQKSVCKISGMGEGRAEKFVNLATFLILLLISANTYNSVTVVQSSEDTLLVTILGLFDD